MENFIINFSLFLALFWVLYLLLFRKETFFNHNRIYLLLAPLVAAVLPFVFISQLNFMGNTPVYWDQISPLILTENVETTTVANEIPSSNSSGSSFIALALVGYGLGALYMLFSFSQKLRQYKKLKATARLAKTKQGAIYYLNHSKMAFTFLNSIFIGEDLNPKDQVRILQHECVHRNQKHSFDLIYYEILKIIFWFHPAVYSLQNQMKLVHEYIADAEVAKNVSKKKYYENLLNGFFGVKQVSFINQFLNHSLIKKRIMMLQKSKSKKAALLKYLIVLPLMIAMLTYVSCSKDDTSSNTENQAVEGVKEITGSGMQVVELSVENINDLSTTENKALSQKVQEALNRDSPINIILTDGENEKTVSINSEDMLKPPPPPAPPTPKSDAISFANIDVVPAYPGCNQSKGKEALKDCTTKEIQKFVGSKFNTDLANDLGIKGITRISTQFKVSENGEIEDIKARSEYPELQEEAIRVIKALPQMQPGLQDGKKVSVTYSLPIVFQVQ